MVKVDEDHIREFANSPAWENVMEPLFGNRIEFQETQLENADTQEAYACKEVWRVLRALKASIEIYRED